MCCGSVQVSACTTVVSCGSPFLLLFSQPLVLDKSTCPSPSMLPLVTRGEMHVMRHTQPRGGEGLREKNVLQRKGEEMSCEAGSRKEEQGDR